MEYYKKLKQFKFLSKTGTFLISGLLLFIFIFLLTPKINFLSNTLDFVIIGITSFNNTFVRLCLYACFGLWLCSVFYTFAGIIGHFLEKYYFYQFREYAIAIAKAAHSYEDNINNEAYLNNAMSAKEVHSISGWNSRHIDDKTAFVTFDFTDKNKENKCYPFEVSLPTCMARAILGNQVLTEKYQNLGFLFADDKMSRKEDIPEKKDSTIALIGLALGILSIFFGGMFGLLPILAIIISSIGLYRFDQTKQKNKWAAIVALILGVLYFFVYLYSYGYLDCLN
ncbi:MAG: DUF4190 domain-containing protein [Eubacteriales bacterium]|nr:DUF4190 domain-containing protein [Eubacteriales bacterium]